MVRTIINRPFAFVHIKALFKDYCFWDATPCNLVRICPKFRASNSGKEMEIEVEGSFETLVIIYQITRRWDLKYSNPQ